MAKYCTKCGNKLNDNARFCNNCGHPVEKLNDSVKKLLIAGGILLFIVTITAIVFGIKAFNKADEISSAVNKLTLHNNTTDSIITVSGFDNTVSVNGKKYNVIDNMISVEDEIPYKVVLGNIEELDDETLRYIANDIESAKVMMALLKNWNMYINEHNTDALATLYNEDVVKYYTAFCNRSDIKDNLEVFFTKHPYFSQRISNVEIDPNNATIRYTKHVRTDAGADETAYQAYFYVISLHADDDNIDLYTNAWIIRESDMTTDNNLKAREDKYPRVELNKNWTLDQLFCGNVNKVLSFQIWDFWNDGDDKDYPLLEKIAIGAGRDSFEGPVYKHYKGKNFYYCEGTTSGAPSETYHNAWWHLIWRYDSQSGDVKQFAY